MQQLKINTSKSVAVCFIIGSMVFISCTSNRNPYENNLGIEPSLMAQMDTANYTVITWLDTLINIGTIKATDTVIIKFRFKNTGNTPLFVIAVQPACGCTVTDYSKEPVQPGKEGVINVVYKWNGQIGELRKTIGVRTNTQNAIWHTLAFHGAIVEDDKVITSLFEE